MSTKTLCDCCGKESCDDCPNPEFTQCGFVDKRDYCQHAKAKWDEYVAKRDEIHDAVALMWKTEIAVLNAEYAEILGKLPDA